MVRQRRALGRARRAGGELDRDRIVELEARLPLGQLAVAGVARVGQEPLPVLLEHDRLAQRVAARAHVGEHGRVVRRAEATGHDEHAHARLAERVAELGGRAGRVDRDQDRADAGRGELRDGPFVAIGRPDGDAIALVHAVRDERAGGGLHLLPELVVGRPVALVGHDERVALAEALDGPAQVLADRLAEQRDVAGAVGIGAAAQADDLAG